MSNLLEDQVLYIEENLNSYLEYINTNIYEYNNKIAQFSKSKFYCDFIFYLNNKKFIQPKIDNLDINIKKFIDLENDENIMSFKSVFFITNKLHDFFTTKDYFFNYFFFTKNLYDTFILYSFNKVSNLSDIQNVKALINNSEIFEIINYYENTINEINDILMKEEYGKITIFGEISNLSIEFKNINILGKEIVTEIINKFTDYETNCEDLEDIDFLNKVYIEIYEKDNIKKYFDGKELYIKKKTDYKQKEYKLNMDLCLQQLELKNLSNLEKSLEDINDKIINVKKERKVVEFDISTKIKNNNNKLNIEERKLNDSIDIKTKLIDELDDRIFTIEEVINEIKKNKNTRLLEKDFNIVKEKSKSYPDNETYKKKMEFIRNKIKPILSSNNFEIKIQMNRLNEANKEKKNLMIDISKMMVRITNLKQQNLEDNKKLNIEKKDNALNLLDIEKENLEIEIGNKKNIIEKVKNNNFKNNKVYKIYYREFIKFTNYFKEENDIIFSKYQIAIQNKEKIKNYIKQLNSKKKKKKLLDDKILECLNKDFYSNYEINFTKRCNKIYNSINENINNDIDNLKELKNIINLISGHHIYNFYSYLIVDLCRVLPEIYSNNIKILINNEINNVINNNIIENNYNFNLEHSKSIINEYKKDKIVKINSDNIYKLEVLLKKRNMVYKYLNKIEKIKEHITIMNTM